MAAIGAPTTAHLCQMRTVNATLLRTVKIRPGMGDLSRNGRQIPEINPSAGSRRLKKSDAAAN
jgi:hypothetical protein